MSSLPAQPGGIILCASQASAWLDGYAFLESAREEAAHLLADAARSVALANAEGFAQGREAGAAEVAQLLLDTTAQVERYMDGLEGQLCELALAIVDQLLDRVEDTELLVRLTRKALANWRDEQELTLRVAPQQLEPIERLLEIQPVRSDLRLTISADPQLGPRQCVLSTAALAVDLSLDAQLLNLRQALTASDLRGEI
jgi:type III secretion protein L